MSLTVVVPDIPQQPDPYILGNQKNQALVKLGHLKYVVNQINAIIPTISGIQSVTGLNTDNTDPFNPVIQISVDGTTITGDGTPGNPLVSVGGSAPIYPANQIPFGDGSTTPLFDANLTFTPIAIGGNLSVSGANGLGSFAFINTDGTTGIVSLSNQLHSVTFNGQSDVIQIAASDNSGGIYYLGSTAIGTLGLVTGLGIDILNDVYTLGNPATSQLLLKASDNTVFAGNQAGAGQTGTNNVIGIGFFAANSQSGANDVIGIGNSAAALQTGTNDVIGIGQGASNSQSGYNVIGIGQLAAKLQSGNNVIGIGAGAAYAQTGIIEVIGIGSEAAQNQSGSYVIGIGNNAASGQLGTNDVIGIGNQAGGSQSGSNVIAIGLLAANGNTFNDVVALGQSATPTMTRQLALGNIDHILIGGKDIDFTAANAAGFWYNDGNGVISYITGVAASLQDTTDVGNTTDNDIQFETGVGLLFDNSARVREGTTDAGTGGSKGVALRCSADYELKWEAGSLYVMEQNGFTIREVSYKFSSTPAFTDDDTKGFVVGSRWILDNGKIYVCSDATSTAAVWDELGDTGSFTTVDLKTVTVTNGLIISII